MSALEELIAEINAAGYLINNIFQSQAYPIGVDRDWQANLRLPPPDTAFFEFGRGPTPLEALQACWEKAQNPTKKPPFTNNMPKFLNKAHVSVPADHKPKTPSLEDLL